MSCVMSVIKNNQECFVQLWLRLERTRRFFWERHKRFTIRNVLKVWFGNEADDDFIREVCHRCEQMGGDELPLPSLYPRKHRELIRAIVSVKLGISHYKIHLKALDAAYSIAFPLSTPINVEKKLKSSMKQARGLRNNNPLNIVKSGIHWQGEVRPSTDPTFAKFETLEYGFRAAFKLLRTYYRKHGCSTIRQIVARWDPEGPKVIAAYVQTVCRQTGLTADQQLPPMKEETQVMWCDIVLAMATMECGLTVAQQEKLAPFIVRGWAMK